MSRRPVSPASERLWYGLGAVAVLLLAWTCRNAAFGVPAADDYDYLYWLTFHRPFDLFDSMGSLFYWRPLGRQIYYAALRPAFFTAPWVVAVVHGVILWATYVVVYRVARRTLSPPLAAAAAAFPILSEPMRTLFVWPTGGEYLLAILASALAIHEALERRWWTAGLAALAGLLSHEASALALPALALVSWRRGDGWRGAAVAAAVALVWFAGHSVARSHGTGWIDRGAASGSSPARWLEASGRVFLSQLNLEELDGRTWTALALGYGAITLIATALLLTRRQKVSAAPGMLGAVAWVLLAAVPLSLLLPNWNAWRSPFAALWLGIGVMGFLGLQRSAVALGFTALRIVALLLSPLAPSSVTREPPPSASGMSFVRVARLQHVANNTREAMLAHAPRLYPGAVIAYWSRLAVAEVAILPPKAPRVWYGDSTIAWEWLWREGGLEGRHDLVVSFETDGARPVVVIEEETLDLVRASIEPTDRMQDRLADSLLVATLHAQSARPSSQLTFWATRNRARIAYRTGAYEQAEILNRTCFELVGPTAENLGLAALLALRRGERATAESLANQAVSAGPNDPIALYARAQVAAPPR